MRTRLPRTYYPFLARFRHPTEIQLEAAGPLLAGEPVLLVSATASGKTEAFTAPLVERYFEGLQAKTEHILLVCPTRALVNDAARRLEAPLRACGLELRRRTGDASESPEEHQSALWITTPEGFDSLLCRHPRWLGRTRAVVLDEIHVLENSPRGSQVLFLLERLDWICKAVNAPPPQRVAATATASCPHQLARLYLGERGRVVAPAQSIRRMRLHYHQWFDFDTLRTELGTIGDAQKVLLFASSRQEAEEAGVQLKGPPPFGNHVAVHHSSLSRSLRLQAEKGFLRQSCALLCCTTTMEVGVDVGDVDWVVLLHPPEDVLAFMQRGGRAGRRQGAAQVVAVFRNPAERLRYQYYLARSRETLAGIGDTVLHDSVIAQQALSLLWQNPRKQITTAALWQRLPPAYQARWTEADIEALLERLQKQGWMDDHAPGWTISPKLERFYARGQLHSNIGGSTQKQVEVRDAMTGRSIGTVQADRRGRVPTQLRLGGRAHQVRQDYRQSGLVAAPAESHVEGVAQGYGPGAPTELASSQDFARWLGLAPRCLLSNAGGNLLGHFLGSVWGEILRRHLEQNYPKALIYADAYVVAWQGSFVEEVWNQEALEGCLTKFAQAAKTKLSLGPWHSRLPREWQRRELLELLRWEWVKEHWLGSPLPVVSGEAAAPLKQLLQSEERLVIAGFFPIDTEDL